MLTSEQRSNLQFVLDTHPTNTQLLARVNAIQDFFPLKHGGLIALDRKTDIWKVTSAGLVRLEAAQ